VSVYRDRILPRLIDRACGTADLRAWRERTLEGLHGEVVEIGFGSGLNVQHYPGEVELVHAVEPAGTALRIARDRIDAHPVSVEEHELDAEQLPLPDHSCDGALSTFTLCTIPDVAAALAEVRRVLKPGGQFHFLEHGLSPDHRIATWQHRLEPFQRRVAGGCHLTRCPADLVEAADFELVWAESRYGRGPKPWTWFTVGVATSP
jgi:SAM-dependent methyltransferase